MSEPPKWGEWCGCGVPTEADIRTKVAATNAGDTVDFVMYHCNAHAGDYTVGKVIETSDKPWTVTEVSVTRLRGED